MRYTFLSIQLYIHAVIRYNFFSVQSYVWRQAYKSFVRFRYFGIMVDLVYFQLHPTEKKWLNSIRSKSLKIKLNWNLQEFSIILALIRYMAFL